jgi:hypothetical protein
MEDVRREFCLRIIKVFPEELNEYVNNDNMLVDCYLMEWLNQWRYSLQENDHKH